MLCREANLFHHSHESRCPKNGPHTVPGVVSCSTGSFRQLLRMRWEEQDSFLRVVDIEVAVHQPSVNDSPVLLAPVNTKMVHLFNDRHFRVQSIVRQHPLTGCGNSG